MKTKNELKQISDHANSLNLSINIDISSTDLKEFSRAVDIAKTLKSKNIRFYIRDSGLVSQIIADAVITIKEMAQIAQANGIGLLLEQHEDLKSFELVEIIKKVDETNLQLMFDYGNMINANEKPLNALENMSPFIKHVHVKGVRILLEGEGFAHLGVAEKEDDLPHAKLMFDLLMLGDKTAQVEIFYLEEVNGYYAPAYRFNNENVDAFIPERTVSITKLEDGSLEKMLNKEKIDAVNQLIFVKSLLSELKTIAKIQLQKIE